MHRVFFPDIDYEDQVVVEKNYKCANALNSNDFREYNERSIVVFKISSSHFIQKSALDFVE
jgi:hypothetical protein